MPQGEDLSVGIPSFDLVNKQENMALQKETNDGYELWTKPREFHDVWWRCCYMEEEEYSV